MFDSHRVLYRFLLDYYERLTADLTDDHLVERPAGNLTPPVWLLGHVAAAAPFTLGLLGREADVDFLRDGWMENFGPGTTPLEYTDGFAPPTLAELQSLIRTGHERVEAALDTVDFHAVGLDEPNPVEFLRAPFPTKRAFLAHLLTTHDAIHAGQLSAWRRAMNLPAV